MSSYNNWHITYVKKAGIFKGNEFRSVLVKDKTLKEAWLQVESSGGHVLTFTAVTDNDDFNFLQGHLAEPSDEN